jgi:hypothetical protein
VDAVERAHTLLARTDAHRDLSCSLDLHDADGWPGPKRSS